jgi:hypothetical protein
MLASTVQFSKNTPHHTHTRTGADTAGHHQENQPQHPRTPHQTQEGDTRDKQKKGGPFPQNPNSVPGPTSPSHPLPTPTTPKQGARQARTHKQPQPTKPNSQRSTIIEQTQPRRTHAYAGGHTPHHPAHPHTKTRANQENGEKLLLRKEVIQPHLPVRLPCYDFVLIAGPTFDHSPPTSGLGHGLRVLPTFMT